jgi:hypothetical protein
MDKWVDVKAITEIAYSNKNVASLFIAIRCNSRQHHSLRETQKIKKVFINKLLFASCTDS